MAADLTEPGDSTGLKVIDAIHVAFRRFIIRFYVALTVETAVVIAFTYWVYQYRH